MANVDFEGKAFYAKVFERNRDTGENLQDGQLKDKITLEQGHYSMNVEVSPETRDLMIAQGVPTKGLIGQLWREGEDGTIVYKCKRPHFNPRINKGEGMLMGPPVVFDGKEGENKWDDSVDIGNGSTVKVRINVWDGKIVTLEGVRVIDHVEFVSDKNPVSGF